MSEEFLYLARKPNGQSVSIFKLKTSVRVRDGQTGNWRTAEVKYDPTLIDGWFWRPGHVELNDYKFKWVDNVGASGGCSAIGKTPAEARFKIAELTGEAV